MKKLLLLMTGTIILGAGSLMTAYAAAPYCNVADCTWAEDHTHEYCQGDHCGQPGSHHQVVLSSRNDCPGRNSGHNRRHH